MAILAFALLPGPPLHAQSDATVQGQVFDASDSVIAGATIYRPYVLGGALIVIVQSALIAALLVQRRRRTRAERDLRDSQQRLTMATAAGAVGVWDWDFTRNQLFVDAGLKSLLGFEDAEITSRPDDWGSRVHPEDLPEAAARVQACIDGVADTYEIEHRMLHKDGSVRWFLSRGTAVRSADGRLHRLVGTKVDVTERRRSAEQFRLAIEAAPAGMILVDCAGVMALVNAQVERISGYARAELIGRPVEMLVPTHALPPPAERAGGAGQVSSKPPAGDDRDLQVVRKDGSQVPVEIGVNPLATSGELLLMSIVDVTERRRSERENRDLLDQLQDLAGSLITAQDSERARIARDLHDDVSQQLAALSIALSGFKRRVGTGSHDTSLEAGLSLLQQRAVTVAESVRALSHDLHPDVLKHAGLTVALSTHCAGVSRSQATAVTCTAEGDFDSIDGETALCLYRVAQEALHNVVKHARARRAEVRLLRVNGIAELTVTDDGKGFDVAETRRQHKGLGLVSINERVRLAGGNFSVMTEWNKGTQIRVRVPTNLAHAPTRATYPADS
jgi:PAS domain S-box-containing protein